MERKKGDEQKINSVHYWELRDEDKNGVEKTICTTNGVAIATEINAADAAFIIEAHNATLGRLKSPGTDTEFKEGDKVCFHSKPGEILEAVIEDIYREEWASLKDVTNWVHLSDLYATQEDAEAALSPEAKRLEGCYREATLLTQTDSELPFIIDATRKNIQISMLAHTLFDLGSRKK